MYLVINKFIKLLVSIKSAQVFILQLFNEQGPLTTPVSKLCVDIMWASFHKLLDFYKLVVVMKPM